ncbi:MAG TPA: succinate dehydrogenase, cytochrome b556 subunit [Acidiferrobacteraceae bacterium]|nr:succinate dehydrogenase, cytochrome b556 subunit [Acidiferrobacteraceae bacterium]
MQREIQRRPVDAGLLHLRFPVGAVVSILHRLSGIAIALLFPVGLWMLGHSLSSPAAFARIQAELASPAARAGVGLCAWLLAHHFFAGVRHLLLDLDIGGSRRTARLSAYVVLLLGALTALWAAL